MTTITYNGINPFSGLAPTPLVSHEVSMIRYGERWGQVDNYSLKGVITGHCTDSVAQFAAKQQQLISGFNQDYQTLIIFDGNSGVISLTGAKLNGIKFDPNTYGQNLLPFEITLQVYPQNYFSGVYGILNPKEEVIFTEEEDGQITLNHNTSAQGFCTDSTNANAFDNAKNYVVGLTGWNSQILPNFINFNDTVCLKEIAINADRINGRYEVREKYISDQYDNGIGILRYTADTSQDEEKGITTVSVKGDIKGCQNQDLTSLRARYSNFDTFSEGVYQLNKAVGRTDLNQIPFSKSVGEDSTHKVITFETVYNDDFRPQIYINYQFSFDYDYENDVITVQVAATVGAKGPFSASLWSQVQAIASSINLYSVAAPAYLDYANLIAPTLANYPLNPNFNGTSRTDNEFDVKVTLSATFSNSVVPPVGLDKYAFTMTFLPAIEQYAPYPILDQNGQYYIFDLGYVRRGSLAVEANGHANDVNTVESVSQNLKNLMLNTQNTYLIGSNKILETQSINQNITDDRTISISATWGADQIEFTIP